MGRRGLLAIFPELEMPFFVQTTSKYKQNESGILLFLRNLNYHHKPLPLATKVYIYSEFGLDPIIRLLKEKLLITPFINTYGRGSVTESFTSEQRNIG